ncbi:MAG TPA: PTS transporter subunit EIIC [Candidatus Baltobacteraceae bacterium]
MALQTTLPYSFAGLVVGVGIFLFVQPPGTLSARFASAFIDGFSVMAAVLVILLTLDLAKRRDVPLAIALPVAWIVFTLLLPLHSATSLTAFANALRSSGLFIAMGASIGTVTLMRVLRSRLPGYLGYALAAAILIGGALALLLTNISVSAALNAMIAPLGHLGDSLPALLIIVLVQQLLWMIGIHGPALLSPVLLPVYLGLQAENTAQLARGVPLSHIVVTSFFLFIWPGGAGATLPLVLLLLRSRIARLRTLAYATIVPGIFNINEPLTFGLPMMFNATLGVPFVIVPLVLSVTTYGAMKWGWVARPAFYVFSWFPAPLGAFLATKDWRAVALVVINLLIAFVFYWPFVRRYERREEARAIQSPEVT